ncbi:MAG: molybdate transporter family protein [Verrucomicrobiia bacterium]
MLLLAVIGGLDWLARAIPKCVIRGIQFGLGLQLASVALAKYVQSDGNAEILLAVLAFVISILLLNNKRLPAALPVIGLGILFALLVKSDAQKLSQPVVAICLPQFSLIGISDIITGFLLLSLPQIPLSIGNSVLATAQITKDLFPARNVSVKKIGITYGIMNLIVPWFGGFPVCHGSGGLVGHYTFGGRTGGSVIIYGSVFLVLGDLFGKSFGHIINIFPLPMLGVLLLFESLGLIYHSRDIAGEKTEFPITILVGLIAAFLAYGFVIGMIIGVGIYYFKNRVNLTSDR